MLSKGQENPLRAPETDEHLRQRVPTEPKYPDRQVALYNFHI